MNFLTIGNFVKANWLKLGIALLLIYAAMRKDFSFQINLNTPVKLEDTDSSLPTPVHPAREKKKQERYTDNSVEAQQLTPNTSAITDRFQFPSLSLDKTSTKTAEYVLSTIDEATKKAFIQRFSKVAHGEEAKFGIPASIILAQGLLSSQAGQNERAIVGNNFFNLPCSSDWQGETLSHNNNCFRYYENAWTSFRDHSLYLTTGKLSHLTKINSQNYKAWAKALEKEKLNEEEDWADQLIKVIEQYQLHGE